MVFFSSSTLLSDHTQFSLVLEVEARASNGSCLGIFTTVGHSEASTSTLLSNHGERNGYEALELQRVNSNKIDPLPCLKSCP